MTTDDESTLNLLSLYRCERSNALWFARLDPRAYGLKTRSASYEFKKGENFTCANYWLEHCRGYWDRLLSARAVQAECTGMTNETPSSVQAADLVPETSRCICPSCIEREIRTLEALL